MAYAKINLGLDVVRRLENGYHEVAMVMQSISLCDVLEMEKAPGGISLFTDSPDLSVGSDNLVYRAAKLIMEECQIHDGIKLMLRKRIPCAAGMAGGSSDAAATLIGINRLYELGLSDERLRQLGQRLGADVPYCILGGTALAEGIGEKLTALRPAPSYTVITAKPDFDVSTKYVYEHLQLDNLTHHPDIRGMVQAIQTGDAEGMLSRMENVLESVTVKKYPLLSVWKEKFLELGAKASLMSGSGPTVFALFDSRQGAEKAYDQFQAYVSDSAVSSQMALSSFREQDRQTEDRGKR
jgi:4-diphosphocytidyl-2-C-methyl-D-erythritol kinase